jgi:two-component system OmpR family sensor kinase
MRSFVADASHELRTPLTSIRGYAELYRLSGTADPAEVTKMMSRIESEATRMGVLVDELLLLAQLDRERPIDFAEVDLATTAAQVAGDARTRAPERQIELQIPQAPVWVRGDEPRLHQVLTNLVDNALTHTEAPASIHITLEIIHSVPSGPEPAAEAGAPIPDTDRLVLLEVVDNGPGIPQEKAAHVFDRFYRADRSRSGARGSGLGLAIVTATLTAHHAHIQLITGAGRGATFRILLAPAQP